MLEQAVAIDPAFAAAHLHLAFVSDFAGRPAARRHYLDKAAEHSDRLNDRQRLLLDIESARIAGNSAVAARRLSELIARFPDAEDAVRRSPGLLYGPVGLLPDPERILAISAAGVAALPASRVTRNLHAYSLLDVGRYEDAVREFEAYVRVAPREANPYDSLGEAHIYMGLPERAVE